MTVWVCEEGKDLGSFLADTPCPDPLVLEDPIWTPSFSESVKVDWSLAKFGNKLSIKPQREELLRQESILNSWKMTLGF